MSDVAAFQLCSGCGACAYLDPARTRMIDDPRFGRRPLVAGGQEPDSRAADALSACPGVRLAHDFDRDDPELLSGLADDWGPVRGIWEACAADGEIRLAGSSGGAATALALFGLERLGMHGVLHIAARPDAPYLNETVMSSDRAALLARTGSRYAPASPCDGLQRIADAPEPCVLIGKPCDIAAARRAADLRPDLGEKLGLTIAFFCAGVPSTQGTLDLLAKAGVSDPRRIESLRYRGNGWPGRWTVVFRDAEGRQRESSMSYEESWGFLVRYKQWRCNICPDHTGEFADIAVGDPWYRPIAPDEPGQSLIVARTKRGRQVIEQALAAGYLAGGPAEPQKLSASQPNLLNTRGAVWGRLLALRLTGTPRPRFLGLPMAGLWWRRLGVREKLQSVIGTLRRIARRGLRRRQALRPATVAGEQGGGDV